MVGFPHEVSSGLCCIGTEVLQAEIGAAQHTNSGIACPLPDGGARQRKVEICANDFFSQAYFSFFYFKEFYLTKVLKI